MTETAIAVPRYLDDPANHNSSFSKQIRGLQIAWDSTSLGMLKECPRKYQYAQVMGIGTREDSVHLVFGSHYHSCMEFYDHRIADGLGHEAAVMATVRHALELTWDSRKGRPWLSDNQYKNRYTLVRAVLWYLDQFGENDPYTTVTLASTGKPAVELSFRYEIGYSNSAGEAYKWCGHLDRVAADQSGAVFIFDYKTSTSLIDAKFFANFNPSNQFTAYILAGQVVYGLPIAGLVVNGVQMAVGFSRFGRQLTTRTEEQLNEWLHSFGYFMQQAETYARDNFWPMQETSCSNYGGCPYRELCSRTPSAREAWIRTMPVKTWDPLQVRGNFT